MIRVTVLFPKTSDSHFDMDYYLTKCVPMSVEKMQSSGFAVSGAVDEGLSGLMPGEPAPFAVIGTMLFENLEDLQAGMAAHGAAILGDFPNFTNVQPVIQVSNVVLGASSGGNL